MGIVDMGYLGAPRQIYLCAANKLILLGDSDLKNKRKDKTKNQNVKKDNMLDRTKKEK